MKDLKQKVFALYWGQRILYMPNTGKIVSNYERYWENFNNNCMLEVTPLHLITDEHKLALYAMGWTYNKKGLQIAPIVEWKAFTPEQIDFLRSNGYATPCFGHSVDSLISQGIFKIKQS